MKFQKLTLIFLFLSFLGLSENELSAQEATSDSGYKSAIGVRLGVPLSVSYKTFVNEKGAIEGFASFRGYDGYSWTSVAGAYQIHNSLDNVMESLQWYYGGGLSGYFWNFDDSFSTDVGSVSVAVNGYLGLDYKFPGKKFNITIDWVPTFFINGFGSGFGGGYGGIGLRYVLK